MHKQEQTFLPKISSSVQQRKGFALILTLSALAVIIALTAVLISYLDVARKDANSSKALIQGNVYYDDIKTLFKGFKDKKSLYTILYNSPIPLMSDDEKFSLLVACKPLASGVNINWLSYENNASMSAQYDAVQKVLSTLVQEYNLEDASNLEMILREEVGYGNKYVQKEQRRLRQKNGIISIRQFKDILDRYQRESDDKNIAQIPWEKYFVFNETSKDPTQNLIDGNYISAELLSFLFDLDIESVKEDWMKGNDLKEYVSTVGETFTQKLFAKDFLAQSTCDIIYGYSGERYGFKFEDIEGEVKHFEFFGKQ
jgi:hypothetical protein